MASWLRKNTRNVHRIKENSLYTEEHRRKNSHKKINI